MRSHGYRYARALTPAPVAFTPQPDGGAPRDTVTLVDRSGGVAHREPRFGSCAAGAPGHDRLAGPADSATVPANARHEPRVGARLRIRRRRAVRRLSLL